VADDERASGGAQRDFEEGVMDLRLVFGSVAADDHTSAGLQERGTDLGDLGRIFARGVDDFGNTFAVLTAGVEDGETVQVAYLAGPQTPGGRLGRESAFRYSGQGFFEVALWIGGLHGAVLFLPGIVVVLTGKI
jgi:hypothetical protein